jgi:hypothetical protein
MKFTKLVNKFEKLVKKHEKGVGIEAGKLTKLQQLLSDKRDRYQASLDATEDAGKREKLETRLRVVNAQLEKSKKLSSTN